MRAKPNKNAEKRKGPDPVIIVALIGLVGTIITALLASPLQDNGSHPNRR